MTSTLLDLITDLQRLTISLRYESPVFTGSRQAHHRLTV
jgi:hypothetical protein